MTKIKDLVEGKPKTKINEAKGISPSSVKIVKAYSEYKGSVGIRVEYYYELEKMERSITWGSIIQRNLNAFFDKKAKDISKHLFKYASKTGADVPMSGSYVGKTSKIVSSPARRPTEKDTEVHRGWHHMSYECQSGKVIIKGTINFTSWAFTLWRAEMEKAVGTAFKVKVESR